MRSLRTYAFAVLLAVGVIPLLVLALVMNANLRWNAVTAANDQLSMVINTSGERLAATMSAINHELAGLRYNPVLRNPGREQSVLQAELDRIRQSNGEYREISCYTADGQLVASSSLSPDLTTPEQDGETLRYLGETIGKGRPVISDPFQKAGHPGWSVSVYLPLQGTNAAIGVIRADLELERMTHLLRGVDMGNAGQLILMDGNGQVLYPAAAGEDGLQQFPSAELKRLSYGLPSGQYHFAGQEWFYVGRSVGMGEGPSGSNWYLAAMLPETEVLQGLGKAQTSVALVFLGSLGLVLAGSLRLSRQAAEVLAMLARAARQVTAHQWHRIKLPVFGPEEVRHASRSFNEMAEAIRIHHEQLSAEVAGNSKVLEEKNAELSRAQGQLDAVLDSSLDGILVTGRNGEVLRMNRPFREFLNLAPGQEWTAETIETELRGKISGPVGFRGFAEDLAPEESTLRDGRREAEWVTAGANEQSFRVCSGAIHGSEDLRIWMFQDVSQARKLERGLEEAQKMEAAGRLAGSVAHDFNNVLAGMMGSLSLLEPSVARDKEAREELRTAQSAVRRAAELAHQLLGGGQKRVQVVPDVDLKRGAGETILVVDDEFLVRNVNERLLKAIGYRTLSAVDGVDGLERYQEHAKEIDLVLLDLTMPNLSGAEVFRQLRQWDPELPIIIYTGYLVDPQAFARDNGSAPNAIVTKPLVIDALAAKIRQILEETGAAPVEFSVAA